MEAQTNIIGLMRLIDIGRSRGGGTGTASRVEASYQQFSCAGQTGGTKPLFGGMSDVCSSTSHMMHVVVHHIGDCYIIITI